MWSVHDRQRDGHEGGAGIPEAAEGQAPALPEDDQREQDECCARDAIGRQHRRGGSQP